jgi:hypothetical protein
LDLQVSAGDRLPFDPAEGSVGQSRRKLGRVRAPAAAGTDDLAGRRDLERMTASRSLAGHSDRGHTGAARVDHGGGAARRQLDVAATCLLDALPRDSVEQQRRRAPWSDELSEGRRTAGNEERLGRFVAAPHEQQADPDNDCRERPSPHGILL